MQNFSTVSPVPAHRNRAGKALAAFLACASVAAFGPAAASAAGAGPTPCVGEVGNPFLPWGDTEPYRIAPDGDFSSTPSQWELDGAELVGSDSPLSGGTALELERNDSALTAPICIDGTESFSRVLTRSENSKRLSGVVVEAVLENGRELPVGIFRGDEEWGISSRILVPGWLAYMGQDSFQYRFTALGKGTTIIDDLYVDPRARH